MIKGIIFDPAHLVMKSDRAWEYACKRYDITKQDILELRKKLIDPAKKGELNKNELESEWTKYFNISLIQAIQDFNKAGKMFDFNIDVLNLIQKFNKSKYKIGVISNTTELFASLYDEGNFYNQYENVILSYQAKAMKPNKKIYKLMLKKLKIKPEECVYIDIKSRDIKPAQDLGMKTILFENIEQFEKELKQYDLI